MNVLYLPIVVFTLCILFYISYQDIKYREINVIYLFVLSIISLFYLWFFIFKGDWSLWRFYFLQLGVTFIFLIVFYILGKISSFLYIGEGDLYAIMALSFTNIFDVYFPMLILFFALFLTLVVPLIIFIYNLVKRNFPKYSFFKSLYVMFLGYPVHIEKITKFYTPLEKFFLKNGKIISSVVYTPKIDSEKEISILNSFTKTNKIQKIWMSPLVPFIILISLSYILVLSIYLLELTSSLLICFI